MIERVECQRKLGWTTYTLTPTPQPAFPPPSIPLSPQALEALFEGVKSPLYPHARPLCSIILDKAKDKKLTSSCSRSLDKLFGNVLGFQDVVEEATNAKDSKNQITRHTCWQWVKRSGEGTRRHTHDG